MRNSKIEFDDLQIYFGKPYVIDLDGVRGKITIHQPKMGQMIDAGYRKFYGTLNIFITNTTSYMLPLWKMNIDWNSISDFDLFIMLYKGIDPDISPLLFEDLDWSEFDVYTKDEKPILYSEKSDIEINYDVYNHISQYFQTVFNLHPEEKITEDPILKRWFIQREERKEATEAKKQESGKTESFSIQPLISACVNHPGFKYKLHEIEEMNVAEFYDSVQRLQIYEQTTALLKGMYSGMISAKDIKPEEYNFMKKLK